MYFRVWSGCCTPFVLPADRPTDRPWANLCVHFLCGFCAFSVRVLNTFRAVRFCAFLFFQAGTELSKQESAYKEVKSTQRKIVEKRGEYAARASEISENQRRLIRSVAARFDTQVRYIIRLLLVITIITTMCNKCYYSLRKCFVACSCLWDVVGVFVFVT